jgi:sulfide:quinone oxidoreductase
MKRVVILGAGTAGTMVANKLSRDLPLKDWQITIVDKDTTHYYQPGFLFIPFRIYKPEDVIKEKEVFLPVGVDYVISEIDALKPDENIVELANGTTLAYDYLVVATGAQLALQETDGLADGEGWRKNIFDFYTYEGALALADFLDTWEGGRLVVNVTELPFKCPVAPLEFLFLADEFFTKKGIRDKVELTFATPLPGAFTKPVCNSVLNDTLENKGVSVYPDYNIMEVDNQAQVIRSFDEKEIPYDLLVSIPTNMGADFIENTGLGDELNFVQVNKHTLQSKAYENVFAIGDASNVPASKAGSVAHFMLDTLVTNIKHQIKGEALEESFDGHANCFIESGYGKAYLIDFNYETQPLPGTYPVPVIGPFKLLEETRINHLGKLAFKEIYWNFLLPARPMPGISDQMQMAGKIPEEKVLAKKKLKAT